MIKQHYKKDLFFEGANWDNLAIVGAIRSVYLQKILILALQKCIAKLSPLATATRSAHESRAHMRVIKGKHYHIEKTANVPAEFHVLSIRRGAWPPSLIILYAHYMIRFEVTYLYFESITGPGID